MIHPLTAAIRHVDHAEAVCVKAAERDKAVEEQQQQEAPDCKSCRRDVTEPEVVFMLESLGRTKTLPYTVRSAGWLSAQCAIKHMGGIAGNPTA